MIHNKYLRQPGAAYINRARSIQSSFTLDFSPGSCFTRTPKPIFHIQGLDQESIFLCATLFNADKYLHSDGFLTNSNN